LDGFGGLVGELGWGPSEFFAKPKVGDGGVGFLASDGSDKKAVSSRFTAQRSLTFLEKNSPNAMGTPSSSLSNLSNVNGKVGVVV
jgi:hypothetical protein